MISKLNQHLKSKALDRAIEQKRREQMTNHEIARKIDNDLEDINEYFELLESRFYSYKTTKIINDIKKNLNALQRSCNDLLIQEDIYTK